MALTAALELYVTPVAVEVTGVTPLVASGVVEANFTATFSGSDQLLEARRLWPMALAAR